MTDHTPTHRRPTQVKDGIPHPKKFMDLAERATAIAQYLERLGVIQQSLGWSVSPLGNHMKTAEQPCRSISW